MKTEGGGLVLIIAINAVLAEAGRRSKSSSASIRSIASDASCLLTDSFVTCPRGRQTTHTRTSGRRRLDGCRATGRARTRIFSRTPL
jgi:hypothetical protein